MAHRSLNGVYERVNFISRIGAKLEMPENLLANRPREWRRVNQPAVQLVVGRDPERKSIIGVFADRLVYGIGGVEDPGEPGMVDVVFNGSSRHTPIIALTLCEYQ